MEKPNKTDKTDKTDKGFQCENPVCLYIEEFPAYVYAHWTLELIFTCKCGWKYSILEGSVSLYSKEEILSGRC